MDPVSILIIIAIVVTAAIVITGLIIYQNIFNHNIRADAGINDFSVSPNITCDSSNCLVRVRFRPENLGNQQTAILYIPIDDGFGNRTQIETRNPIDLSFNAEALNLSSENTVSNTFAFSVALNETPSNVPNNASYAEITRLNDLAPLKTVRSFLYASETPTQETRLSFQSSFSSSSEFKGAIACKGMSLRSLSIGSPIVIVLSHESNDIEAETEVLTQVFNGLPISLEVINDSDRVIATYQTTHNGNVPLNDASIDEFISLKFSVSLPDTLESWPLMTEYSVGIDVVFTCP